MQYKTIAAVLIGLSASGAVAKPLEARAAQQYGVEEYPSSSERQNTEAYRQGESADKNFRGGLDANEGVEGNRQDATSVEGTNQQGTAGSTYDQQFGKEFSNGIDQLNGKSTGYDKELNINKGYSNGKEFNTVNDGRTNQYVNQGLDANRFDGQEIQGNRNLQGSVEGEKGYNSNVEAERENGEREEQYPSSSYGTEYPYGRTNGVYGGGNGGVIPYGGRTNGVYGGGNGGVIPYGGRTNGIYGGGYPYGRRTNGIYGGGVMPYTGRTNGIYGGGSYPYGHRTNGVYGGGNGINGGRTNGLIPCHQCGGGLRQTQRINGEEPGYTTLGHNYKRTVSEDYADNGNLGQCTFEYNYAACSLNGGYYGDGITGESGDYNGLENEGGSRRGNYELNKLAGSRSTNWGRNSVTGNGNI